MDAGVKCCEAIWDGVQCERDGSMRFVANPNASLAGMQMKFSCWELHICDECWPRVQEELRKGSERGTGSREAE